MVVKSSDELGALSYLALRRGVGIIALILPFALLTGHAINRAFIADEKVDFPGSISAYYYTSMRNVFVGALCAMAIFLFSYRYGVASKKWSNRAAAFALGVALVPTARPKTLGEPAEDPSGGEIFLRVVHLGSAVCFFAVLAYFCLRIFRESDHLTPGPNKAGRNRVYAICGWGICAMLVLALLNAVLDQWATSYNIDQAKPLFWLETFMVLFFAVAWLTKGGWGLYRDRVPNAEPASHGRTAAGEPAPRPSPASSDTA